MRLSGEGEREAESRRRVEGVGGGVDGTVNEVQDDDNNNIE